MSRRLYIGSLPFSTTEDELETLFSRFGRVVSVKIAVDRYSGQSRGFGFVEMANDNEAMAAIAGLDLSEYCGRIIKVNEARPAEANH